MKNEHTICARNINLLSKMSVLDQAWYGFIGSDSKAQLLDHCQLWTRATQVSLQPKLHSSQFSAAKQVNTLNCRDICTDKLSQMAEKAKVDCSLSTSVRTSARDSGLTCRKWLMRETMNHHCDANVEGPHKPKINQMSSFQWRRTLVVPHMLHCNLGLSLFLTRKGHLLTSDLVSYFQFSVPQIWILINRAALYVTSHWSLKSWSYPSITSLSETLNFNMDWGIDCFLLICIQRTYLSLIKVQHKYYMWGLEVGRLR